MTMQLLTPRRNHIIDASEAEKLRPGDNQYMSDVNAAVMLGASRSSHIILAATVLFFVVALIWAANANLDEVTRGEGKVIPSNKIQVIQHGPCPSFIHIGPPGLVQTHPVIGES